MIDTITAIGEAVAIIVACWTIISGVGAWRREFIGKRKIEIAEDVLACFFELCDAVAFIRSPFSGSREGRTRVRGDHETQEQSELLDRAYIVYERYEEKNKVFNRMNTLKYRFMASFGKETESIFKDINMTVNTIFVSANILGRRYWPRQGRVEMSNEEFQRHLDEMERHEGIFWDSGKEDNQIRKELASHLKRLEAATAPCFEERMKTYKFMTSSILPSFTKKG